ncbi:O-methyltransferase [Kibdelosporangium phytohabitans]|uniref:Methyltransferase n=1 Tax=Kibdelosporangium phytohabitans TaxID=860235 RepID=A0A0N9HPV5_9PSEU|nr:O-methyltransferase [Kibdelosporangium phytohabitans]ALG06675.1 methyltransferase [Kibdelosporangium phytohabitans]MBE1467891.1 putative O-methyltransferase YrrM [Kibdelosporangium phytohabitans]
MTPEWPAGLRDYVEDYLAEDETLSAARARGRELGCVPIGPAGGAALQFLATALQAKAVVEIGTGAGLSGLYLLRGMAQDGVLTSIDVQPEHQAAARQAFAGAGVAPGRTRLIMGSALDVLPRLTDSGYDLIFVDALKTEYPAYYEHGVRLLRPGGVLAFDNVLWGGRVVDPNDQEPHTNALREVTRLVKDDDRLVPVLLPIGDGLLVAAKTA